MLILFALSLGSGTSLMVMGYICDWPLSKANFSFGLCVGFFIGILMPGIVLVAGLLTKRHNLFVSLLIIILLDVIFMVLFYVYVASGAAV